MILNCWQLDSVASLSPDYIIYTNDKVQRWFTQMTRFNAGSTLVQVQAHLYVCKSCDLPGKGDALVLIGEHHVHFQTDAFKGYLSILQ